MCNELGEWLHLRPAEAKTQAKVAAASDVDTVLLASRIEKAKAIYNQAKLVSTNLHGMDTKAFSLMEGYAIPLKVGGKLCDWLYINGNHEEVLEGEPVPGATATLKGSVPTKRTVLTPLFTDALWLHHLAKEQTTVVCCATLNNLHHVALKMRDALIAIPNTLDALEIMQTLPNDFMMPDEKNRGFCESDYKFKPGRIIPNGEAGQIYLERIDNE
jgi:hypothetical protein